MKEQTRKAMAFGILVSLGLPQKNDEDVLTVKAARKIFHTEWSDEDIQIMCDYIRENGVDDSLDWPNGTEWIYKQISRLALHQATDYQVLIWLREIWGADRTLAYIIDCEQNL